MKHLIEALSQSPQSFLSGFAAGKWYFTTCVNETKSMSEREREKIERGGWDREKE